MSHLYSKANFQSISQCFKVIESYARKARKELEGIDSILDDKIVCDKAECSQRQYKDHNGGST